MTRAGAPLSSPRSVGMRGIMSLPLLKKVVILNRALFRWSAPRKVSVRGLYIGFQDLLLFPQRQIKVEMLKQVQHDNLMAKQAGRPTLR